MFYSIKKIMKEIKVKDGQNSRKALLRKAKIDDPARVKKLGRVKYGISKSEYSLQWNTFFRRSFLFIDFFSRFVEPDITVKLKEDIADNLRLLKVMISNL